MNKIAKALCDAGVLKTGLFTYASGKRGPVYVDIRVLPSYPKSMQLVTYKLAEVVKKIKPDVVAGAETAGIPLAAVVSIKTGIPMVYVRKKPKEHGTKAQIEGILEDGKKTVLIDDMMTDGGSKLNFINGIRDAKGIVEDAVIVLDREQGGAETLKNVGVRLHSLITLKELLAYMKSKKLIPEKEFDNIMLYLKNPEEWEKTQK